MKTFNFIDKINCTIIRNDVTNENDKFSFNPNTSVSNTNIVYKTIFYRTHDSQSISIRSNVTQTIGINLGDYFTKVSTFKMKLSGYEFTESGRNDVYVLFTIPASQISARYGKYDIVNAEDDNYITSGNYSLV